MDRAGDQQQMEKRRVGLRYCPLEPGELMTWEDCARCPHHPEPPFALCWARLGTPPPRRRGFWDQESGW